MSDLIDRQAAIDAVEFGITYAKAINKSTGEVKELFKEGNKALNDAVERIKDLPSAQSEPSQAARDIATILENEKDMRVIKKNAESESCADTISRKAAIDALMKRDKELRNINWYDKPFAEGECKGIDDALEIINTLPSAQSTMGQVFDGDMISRQAAVDAIENTDWYHLMDGVMVRGANSKEHQAWYKEQDIYKALEQLPSAQPEVLACGEGELSAQPDYQEVLGWLLAYHTMSFDLHGRYLPHEVISWLINDFTKGFIAERKTDEAD